MVPVPTWRGPYVWVKIASVTNESPLANSSRMRLPFLNRYAVGITATSNVYTSPGCNNASAASVYHGACGSDHRGSSARCDALSQPFVTIRERGFASALRSSSGLRRLIGKLHEKVGVGVSR